MSHSQKINKTRYSLKEILSSEWDVSTIHDYSDTEMEGPGAGTAVYSSAKWRGNVGLIYSPDHRFSHHLHFYATERAFPTVPGYIRTDIGTTWRPNDDWELSLHIYNLFDPQHPEFHSAVNGGFVHEVPRTAYLQVRRWF